MAFQISILEDLNAFMKTYQAPTIVMNNPPKDLGLYELLRGSHGSQDFQGGDYHEWFIDTEQNYITQAFYENKDIPTGRGVSGVKAKVGMREVITNIGLTKHGIDFNQGGTTSWANALDLALQKEMTDFQYTLSILSLGDGTGKLAEIVSGTNAGQISGGKFDTKYSITYTCDNTYTNFGWDNVRLLKKGMTVDVYDGATLKNEGAVVTAVTYGNRKNGAATTGTVTLACTENTTVSSCDGWLIYVTGSKNMMPMGLTGLVQPAGLFGDTTSTIWNLTRSSYECLQPYKMDGSDLGGSDGTPTTWGLSDLSDMLDQVEFGNYEGDTNPSYLLMHPLMAQCIWRLNRGGFQQVISDNGSGLPMAVGSQRATSFLSPTGATIPIKTHRLIPENVIFGVKMEDLFWLDKGGFEFLGPKLGYSGTWIKTMGDRKANFEAPYGGYFNTGGTRLDRCFVMLDLRNDLS